MKPEVTRVSEQSYNIPFTVNTHSCDFIRKKLKVCILEKRQITFKGYICLGNMSIALKKSYLKHLYRKGILYVGNLQCKC